MDQNGAYINAFKAGVNMDSRENIQIILKICYELLPPACVWQIKVLLHIIFLDCKQDFGAGASMLWPFSIVGAEARIGEKSEPESV